MATELENETHPFDMLCHECNLNDCNSRLSGCLQGKTIRASGMKIRLNKHISWEKKNEIMIKAGMACLLGELIDIHELSPMVSMYEQIPVEDLLFRNPQRVMYK